MARMRDNPIAFELTDISNIDEDYVCPVVHGDHVIHLDGYYFGICRLKQLFVNSLVHRATLRLIARWAVAPFGLRDIREFVPSAPGARPNALARPCRSR